MQNALAPHEYADQLRKKADECLSHSKTLLNEGRSARRRGANRQALKLINQASVQIEESRSLRELADQVDKDAAKTRSKNKSDQGGVFGRITNGLIRAFSID